MICVAPSSNVERPGSPGYFERQGIERTLFKRLFFLGQLSVPEKNSSNTHTQSRSNSNKSKDILNRVSFTDLSHQRLSVPKVESSENGMLQRLDSNWHYLNKILFYSRLVCVHLFINSTSTCTSLMFTITTAAAITTSIL